MDFLSVRQSDVGGKVANAVRPSTFRPANSRLVILVHGYNVNRRAGEDSYVAFGRLLENHGVRNPSIFGHIVGFSWPGDVNLSVFSGLFYPTKIGTTKTSAALLADFLVGLRGPQEAPIQVIIVAHSLGNRVALEAIKQILEEPDQTWGRIEGLCLMAAAVPVSKVEDATNLGRAAQATKTRTLFSKDDTVLHWAFPPGETAAFDGWFPQAVGRFGNPLPAWTGRFDLQPYSHGDYFTGKGGDDRSARYVAQFLGAAVSTQPARTEPTSHVLPMPNRILSRRIGGS